MTLPSEELRALHQTEDFLDALINPRLTKKVPRQIRKRALSCLRHYPHKDRLRVIYHHWWVYRPGKKGLLF